MRVVLLVLATLAVAQGHMRFLEPPCRACIWRFPEYASYNPEPRGNDDEFWCGNERLLEDVAGRCGICGDDVNQPMPRETERGGRYWRDLQVRTYAAGAVRI